MTDLEKKKKKSIINQIKKITDKFPNTKCDYCNCEEIKYIRLRDKYELCNYIMVCKNCTASASCHIGTLTAMGRLAKEPLRKLRRKIHNIIHKKNYIRRSHIYERLRSTYTPHMKEFHVSWLTESNAKRLYEDLTENTVFKSYILGNYNLNKKS